jgi:PEP-CTERM motif
MRIVLTAAVLACLTVASTAEADLITDNFQFKNLSSDHFTVTGSFTYDTTIPVTAPGGNVTTITVDDAIVGSLTEAAPTAISFNGTSLSGSFSASISSPPYRYSGSGSFSSGPAGSLVFEVTRNGIPVENDGVSGPLTITSSVAPAPEPSTLVMAGTALAASAVCLRSRRRRKPAVV